MSFDLISRTTPKARKDYKCIWCPEMILKGETHVRQVGSYYGEFQDSRFHIECDNAAQRFFKESGEEEFAEHEFQRGSTLEYKRNNLSPQ